MMKWVSSPNINLVNQNLQNQGVHQPQCTCMLCQYTHRDTSSSLKRISKPKRSPCQKYMSRTISRVTGLKCANKISEPNKDDDTQSSISLFTRKPKKNKTHKAIEKSKFNSLPSMFRKKVKRWESLQAKSILPIYRCLHIIFFRYVVLNVLDK